MRAIITKAAGNPFFLEEVTRTVQEQGVHGPSLGVPETVQAVLAARIDRLSPEAKSLLQVAAICGPEVSFPLLHAVVTQPEDTVQHHLAVLQAAELIAPRQLFPTPLYAFQHVLTQEVAYQSLLVSTRQQLHHQVAEVLTAHFPDLVANQPERVAHHYTEAGLYALAVPYWQRAGAHASQRSAYREAVSHLTRGLEVLARLPDTPEWVQHELQLQITLGPALIALQGYWGPDVERTYARARSLCQQISASPQLFRVLRGLQWFYVSRGDLQMASTLGEQLLTLAQSTPDPELLLEAHSALGSALYFIGTLPRAQAHFAQAIALYNPAQHSVLAALSGTDPGPFTFAFVALTLWHLGYPDQALRHSHTALTLAREGPHPLTYLHTLAYVALLHLYRGEGHTAQTWAEAAITGLAELECTSFLFLGTSVRGAALVMQGQEAAGLEALCQGLDAWRASGNKTGLTNGLGMLAEAYGQGKQSATGLAVLAEALALVNTTGEQFWEAELYRLQGELLLQTADASQAEGCFRQALDSARQRQAKALELRAAMSLSRLWQAQGKDAAAHAVLAAIYGWFTEGFDTADLQAARALLVALGHF